MTERSLRQLLKLLDDESDPDGVIRAEIEEELVYIDAAQAAETYRQETQWDSGYVYDLTHYNSGFDD